ncbi:hypothetical protein [Streptomyces sp. NPDC057702]
MNAPPRGGECAARDTVPLAMTPVLVVAPRAAAAGAGGLAWLGAVVGGF